MIYKDTIELWHGGKDLEYSYHTFKPTKKQRWVHGPGLYLTTHYERALKYAKGRGSTYKIELNIDNTKEIHQVDIPIENALEFIQKNIIKKHQTKIIEDIYEAMDRKNSISHIPASSFLNLIINYEAIQNSKTKALNQFLIDQGVDYEAVTNYGGRNETVFVIYNLSIIQSVKAIPAKNVSLDDWVFEIDPNISTPHKISKPTTILKM